MRVIWLLLLLVPSAAGLSADENILYTHARSNGELWMNSDMLDHRQDESAWGQTVPATEMQWTIPLRPSLQETVHLDANGTVVMRVFVGGQDRVGTATLRCSFTVDGEPLAIGEGKNVTLTPGYQEVIWEVPPRQTVVPHFALDVVWSVQANGAWSGIFMAMDPDGRQSNVALPLLDVSEPDQVGDAEETPLPPAVAALGLGAAFMLRRRLAP